MSNGPSNWSRVNFVTIFGDLYRIKLWGICNNFNQFAHLSSASGPSNDVNQNGGQRTIIMRMYLEKNKVCWQKTVLLIYLMPVLLQTLNRNHIYTEFYFEMQ